MFINSIKNLILLGGVILALAGVPLITAQQSLEPYTSVTGTIDSPGATETWTLAGREGSMISLMVNGEGDFDPILSLANSGGDVLVQNDDFAYPGRTDSLLQAITLPRNDTYTVTVAGYGNSTGDYTLSYTLGYPEIALDYTFEGGDGWVASRNALSVEEGFGRVTLAIDGLQQSGYAIAGTSGEFGDFHARVRVLNVSGRNGWIIGITLRQTDDGYYLLAFNDRGQWRLTYHEGSNERIIRNWTNHPAIRAEASSFIISVAANGRGFDVFYDDVYVGQANDLEANTNPTGEVALYASTVNVAGSQTVVEYDNFVLTVPIQVGEAEVIPNQLMPGPLSLTIQELERRRMIPTGGQQGLTVAESSGRQINPGVNRVMLGRGTRFGPMVVSTVLNWQAAGPGITGCGLIFDHIDDENYSLAFVDQTGGHGLSTREGAGFSSGLFAEDAALGPGPHHLLIVRLDERVHYYLNRHHMGSVELTLNEGEVGNAVINYETLDNNCQFSDTWVWRLQTVTGSP